MRVSSAPKIRIAVIDQFSDSATGHGQRVESVLSQSCEADHETLCFDNIHSTDHASTELGKLAVDEFRPALRRHVVQRYMGFYEATTANLKSALEQGARVVNQSQSQSVAKVVRFSVAQLRDDPEFAARVREAYGLGADAELDELSEAIIEEVHQTVESHPGILDRRQSYLETSRQAYEGGVVQVIPSGNLGVQSRAYQIWGIDSRPDTFQSVLVSPYTTVVGSVDGHRTPEVGDDTPHRGTSEFAGAEFAVNGRHLEWKVAEESGSGSGTSYAAPQVAALAAEMLSLHPEWGSDQVEAELRGFCRPLPGAEHQVGAGAIDQPAVRASLRGSLKAPVHLFQ